MLLLEEEDDEDEDEDEHLELFAVLGVALLLLALLGVALLLLTLLGVALLLLALLPSTTSKALAIKEIKRMQRRSFILCICLYKIGTCSVYERTKLFMRALSRRSSSMARRDPLSCVARKDRLSRRNNALSSNHGVLKCQLSSHLHMA